MKYLFIGLLLFTTINALAKIPVNLDDRYASLSIGDVNEVKKYVQSREEDLKNIDIVSFNIANHNDLYPEKFAFIPTRKSVRMFLDGHHGTVDDIKKQIELTIISRSYDLKKVSVFFDTTHANMSLIEARKFVQSVSKMQDTLKHFEVKEVRIASSTNELKYSDGKVIYLDGADSPTSAQLLKSLKNKIGRIQSNS